MLIAQLILIECQPVGIVTYGVIGSNLCHVPLLYVSMQYFQHACYTALYVAI